MTQHIPIYLQTWSIYITHWLSNCLALSCFLGSLQRLFLRTNSTQRSPWQGTLVRSNQINQHVSGISFGHYSPLFGSTQHVWLCLYRNFGIPTAEPAAHSSLVLKACLGHLGTTPTPLATSGEKVATLSCKIQQAQISEPDTSEPANKFGHSCQVVGTQYLKPLSKGTCPSHWSFSLIFSSAARCALPFWGVTVLTESAARSQPLPLHAPARHSWRCYHHLQPGRLQHVELPRNLDMSTIQLLDWLSELMLYVYCKSKW